MPASNPFSTRHTADELARALQFILVTDEEERSTVRFVHYTTQGYFGQTWCHWFLDTRAEITMICVTYLPFSAFGSGPYRLYDEFRERLRANLLYDYAARNWGNHCHQASTFPSEAMDFITRQVKARGGEPSVVRIQAGSNL